MRPQFTSANTTRTGFSRPEADESDGLLLRWREKRAGGAAEPDASCVRHERERLRPRCLKCQWLLAVDVLGRFEAAACDVGVGDLGSQVDDDIDVVVAEQFVEIGVREVASTSRKRALRVSASAQAPDTLPQVTTAAPMDSIRLVDPISRSAPNSRPCDGSCLPNSTLI